jgi:hypothetical protein
LSGTFPRSITWLVKRDDISALLLGLESSDIRGPISFYLMKQLFAHSLLGDGHTLIDAVAHFGVVRCFHFLLLNRVSVFWRMMSHAVAGGNIEIFRLCEQQSQSFEGMVDTAVESFRFDVLDWLTDVLSGAGFDFCNSTHLALTRDQLQAKIDFEISAFSSFPMTTITFFYLAFPDLLSSESLPLIKVPSEFRCLRSSNCT